MRSKADIGLVIQQELFYKLSKNARQYILEVLGCSDDPFPENPGEASLDFQQVDNVWFYLFIKKDFRVKIDEEDIVREISLEGVIDEMLEKGVDDFYIVIAYHNLDEQSYSFGSGKDPYGLKMVKSVRLSYGT
jgi:hypothetical protein